ncbi:Spy/CpxP family protein refolding chaperone [Oryzomonas japonica]|uniref:Spy/CpxP family protein refolding chaperone n=1 Tax=Oryzomonas japonica TaxID=2603858 RepID=A0A7J4ZN69_9BACT|nr:Spy/CpxP family protein refolding chaperone [Oryzomonas japonica]KAB0664108.1 Spy/CpxP family protein refolding chaperone [Oryzomonas japonica]
MKRQIMVCVLLAATTLGANGGWAGATGEGGHRGMDERGWGVPGMVPPPPSEEMVARMAQRLKLTSDQQAKVKAVFAAEREKTAPLMQKMAEYHKQLRDTSRAATFDEAAIRAIATKEAQAEVELLVSFERTRSRVNALLTPEQRALAEKCPPPPPHRGHGPEERCGCGHGPGHMPPPCDDGPGKDGDRMPGPGGPGEEQR